MRTPMIASLVGFLTVSGCQNGVGVTSDCVDTTGGYTHGVDGQETTSAEFDRENFVPTYLRKSHRPFMFYPGQVRRGSIPRDELGRLTYDMDFGNFDNRTTEDLRDAPMLYGFTADHLQLATGEDGKQDQRHHRVLAGLFACTGEGPELQLIFAEKYHGFDERFDKPDGTPRDVTESAKFVGYSQIFDPFDQNIIDYSTEDSIAHGLSKDGTPEGDRGHVLTPQELHDEVIWQLHRFMAHAGVLENEYWALCD